MSKILEYNGFRTMATWLANAIKTQLGKEITGYINRTEFLWVETSANVIAINTELQTAKDESREPQEITLPDLVDGQQVSLVPSSTTTYMYS